MTSTIREILVEAQQRFGPEVAVRYKVGKNQIEDKTYNQLRQDSESFSSALAALGEQGSHIAVIGPTSYRWMVTYLGIVNSGSVAVPLDASLPAADAWELLDRADVTTLVADAARKDVAEGAKEHCPKLKHVVLMQQEAHSDDALSLPQLLTEHQTAFDFEPQPDQLCTIMFTSGTTGKSKGVMLTHRNLAENAGSINMDLPERMVLLSVLPIHHAYCLCLDVLKAISLGSIICINDSLLRVMKNIQLFKPEMILMVPLMIETIAKKLEDNTLLPPKLVKNAVFGKQLTKISSGGAYLDPDYVDKFKEYDALQALFEKYGITILQGYGMTECSPVISTTRPWNINKNAVGQLIDNCEAKTVDGELWVRGSSVMQGYYKMPEETAATLEDGWLKTGDLGYVDEEGFVYLTGRKKNLIITKNGENVSPEELENKLGVERLIQEVLVRENKSVIEAEIFPDYEYAKKKHIKDVRAALQEIIDQYNLQAPPHKKIYSLIVRETEFEKTPSKKIKRF